MKEENFENHLSKIFENHLREFFEKSLAEKLEDSSKHFDKIVVGEWEDGQFSPKSAVSFPKLKVALEKVSAYLKKGYCGEKDSQHEEFILKMQESELKQYLNLKWEEAFFLLTPLFLTTFYLFDATGSKLLSQELREEMLSESELDTPRKRRDASRKYLVQLLSDGNLTHGGSKGFYWDKEKRMQLLAKFNRYSLVIKHARNDFNRLEKKISHREMKKRLQTQYEIPDRYIDDIFVKATPSECALKWAKLELQNDTGDENLKDRVLNQAKRENPAPKMSDDKKRILVSFSVKDSKVKKLFIDPKNKSITRKLRYNVPDIPFS